MNKSEVLRKLGNNECFNCPFPHVHPRHELAFFKDFDSHFRTFGNREDHLSVSRLHEELVWKLRHAESEKRSVSAEDLRELSLKAWFEAVRQGTGKQVQVVQHK